MYIKSIYIKNFKGFKQFRMDFSDGINILVGDNEAGKTTILEAINLGLTGIYNYRYLKNELSQYLFNKEAVDEYLSSVSSEGKTLPPPSILIEIYFNDNSYPLFSGDFNSLKGNNTGVVLRIEFDDNYKQAYEALLKEEIKSLPIEFYKISWSSFSRDFITSRQIPLKSLLIDSTHTHKDFSDNFIAKVVKSVADDKTIIDVAQAFRKSQDVFATHDSLSRINHMIIGENERFSNKKIKLSIDDSSVNAWERVLSTYLDDIPFDNIGKGEQSILKTQMCLARSSSSNSSVIMIEEPENHLSYSKLNEFIDLISKNCTNHQIIITTHSSFVANKLGLNRLLLLSNKKTMKLTDLTLRTAEYFSKLAGYDTLRMLLCKRAILVEGASDELIVQKAYLNKNKKLPIEDGIDVISVGNLSFLRFLEIAVALSLKVTIVTDNDGDIEGLKKKYKDYLGLTNIRICYDLDIRSGDLKIGERNFNYNTLEPSIVAANSIEIMNTILSKSFTELNELHKYMKGNKTDCALKIFNADLTDIGFRFPQYIENAIIE